MRGAAFGLVLVAALLGGCSAPDPIQLAVGHLIDRQAPEGLFRYEFDFVSGRWSGQDNRVRQAGAAYALAEYLTHHDEPRVRDAVRRALGAFTDASIPYADGQLLSVGNDPRKAKVGATALALIAGLWFRQVTGDPYFDNQLHAWRSGLLALRNPNGLFFSRPGSGTESTYSNGETWLALALFQEVFPADSAVRRLLPEVDQQVFERYRDAAEIGFFHWGMLAAAARYRATADPRLVDFVYRQANSFLTDLRPAVNTTSNSCYAVEGMAAALEVLRAADRSPALRQSLEIRIALEMQKNRLLQVPADADYLALGGERRLYSPDLAAFSGAFLNGLTRLKSRIDATQHCLSALLKTAPVRLSHGLVTGR